MWTWQQAPSERGLWIVWWAELVPSSVSGYIHFCFGAKGPSVLQRVSAPLWAEVWWIERPQDSHPVVARDAQVLWMRSPLLCCSLHVMLQTLDVCKTKLGWCGRVVGAEWWWLDSWWWTGMQVEKQGTPGAMWKKQLHFRGQLLVCTGILLSGEMVKRPVLSGIQWRHGAFTVEGSGIR